MIKLPKSIKADCLRTGPAHFCARVWDVDASTGKKLMLALEEGNTRLGALRAAVLSYHASRIFTAQLLAEALR